MSEIEQRRIIHFYYLKGKTPAKIHQKLVDINVEYWYHEFKCGRAKIDDKPRFGRPPLDDLDAIILKTLTEYPFSSVSQISNVCGCSYGSAYNRLTEVLGYKNYSLCWVPYSLTIDLKKKRVNGAQELKSILISESQNDFNNLITGDQSWFFLTYEPTKKWSISTHGPTFLTLTDFFLFGYLKGKLSGLSFSSPEELFDAITEILYEIPCDTLNKVFESWIRRCDEIINNNGEYIKLILLYFNIVILICFFNSRSKNFLIPLYI